MSVLIIGPGRIAEAHLKASRFLGNKVFEIYGGKSETLASKVKFFQEKYDCEVKILNEIKRNSQRKYVVICAPMGVSYKYLFEKNITDLPTIFEKPLLLGITDQSKISQIEQILITKKTSLIVNYQYPFLVGNLKKKLLKTGNDVEIRISTNGNCVFEKNAFDLLGHGTSILMALGLQLNQMISKIKIGENLTSLVLKGTENNARISVQQGEELARLFSININGLIYTRKIVTTSPIQYLLQEENRYHTTQVIDPFISQHRKVLNFSNDKIREELIGFYKMEKFLAEIIQKGIRP